MIQTKVPLKTIYLGLGSNLGNRESNIQIAIQQLKDQGILVEKISSIIETDPVGGPPQGKFLNLVLRGKTALPAHQLLTSVKSIEKKLGRTPTVQNGPRTIDIDILLYGSDKINNHDLIIPHPRMRERSFVMQPLKEIAPQLAKELLHENCPNH